MSPHKRSSRRNRREPLRQRIPAASRSTVSDTRSSNAQPSKESTAEKLLLSGGENFVVGSWEILPLEIVPLYAALSAIHQAIGDRPTYSTIIASAQLARGLEYLGFDAELIPASTTVFRMENGRKKVVNIGVWNHPPLMRDNGTTDGHVVVWAASFKRCVDLGGCQNWILRRTAAENGGTVLPWVAPFPGGRRQLVGQIPAIISGQFAFTWALFPQWGPGFESLLAHHARAIEHGGLALGHVVVDLLSALAVHRDLGELLQRYPHLDGLVSGRTLLPELDEDFSGSGGRTKQVHGNDDGAT
jgi:hypothetical protein